MTLGGGLLTGWISKGSSDWGVWPGGSHLTVHRGRHEVTNFSPTPSAPAYFVQSRRKPVFTRPTSVMWSETIGPRTRPVWDQKIGLGLGLASLMLCCEIRSCHARRHNDLERHSNFSSTIYSFFSILCLEHHYCGDQQWRSLTYKLNPPSAFVYFRWSWTCKQRSWSSSCYFSLGLKNSVLFTSMSRLSVIYFM